MLRQEVDVVDHQNIRGPEVMAEILHATRLHTLVEQIHECGAGDVADRRIRTIPEDSLADGLEEVGLPQPDTTMDEVRVVGTTGLFSDRIGCHQREPVPRAHDEVVEYIVGTQNHLLCGEIDSVLIGS